jgi:hypothetical protein
MAESIADKLKKAWKHITTDSNELAKELRRLNPNYMYQSGSKKTALVKRAKSNIKKNKASVPRKKKALPVDKPAKTYGGQLTTKKKALPVDKPAKTYGGQLTTKKKALPVDKPAKTYGGQLTTKKKASPKRATSIAEAKRMGVPHFYNKAGKKLAAVTKEELAASGAKDLTAYLNRPKSGKSRFTPQSKKIIKPKEITKKTTTTSSAKTPPQGLRPPSVREKSKPPQGLRPPSVMEKSKPPQGLRPPSVREKSRAKTPKKSGKGTLGFKQISGKKDWSGGIREYETPFGNITLDSSQENLTDEQKERKKIGLSYKKGGQIKVPKKKKVGKKKQGYKARKDESIAMRVKKKRTKKQLKASRSDSYGKFGKGKGKGKINRSGAALVAASYD